MMPHFVSVIKISQREYIDINITVLLVNVNILCFFY